MDYKKCFRRLYWYTNHLIKATSDFSSHTLKSIEFIDVREVTITKIKHGGEYELLPSYLMR